VKFKVYAVPGLPLEIEATDAAKLSSLGTTITLTPDDATFGIGGVVEGTSIIAYA
jgi:hypothetical protein